MQVQEDHATGVHVDLLRGRKVRTSRDPDVLQDGYGDQEWIVADGADAEEGDGEEVSIAATPPTRSRGLRKSGGVAVIEIPDEPGEQELTPLQACRSARLTC